MYIIYFNTNVTAHTHCFFHKYHRTPHLVTGFITSKTVTKTCAKIACKHLVNIQLSDRFLSTLAMKKGSHTIGLLLTAKATFKFHRKFTFTYIDLSE